MVLANAERWHETDGQILAMVVIETLSRICCEHVKVCEFVNLNIQAIRKILKKFDKKLVDFTLPMKDKYI